MGAVDSVGVRGVVEHDAMRQRGRRDRLDIFARDVGASVEQRANLAAEYQRLCAARARAEHHVAIDGFLVDRARRIGDELGVSGLRRADHPRRILLDRRRRDDIAHQFLERLDAHRGFFAGKRGLDAGFLGYRSSSR